MSGKVLTVKAGDRYPTYWQVPADLTGSTVRLIARRGSNPAVILPSMIDSAPNGIVRHDLDGSLTVGLYAVELEITQGSYVITAPTETYENLRVIADLD